MGSYVHDSKGRGHPYSPIALILSIFSPTQIGAFDEQGRLFSLIHDTRLGGPNALLICQVSLETLSEGNAAQVLTECMEKGEHAEVKDLALESLPHMFILKDGDVVGILFERELRVVALVVNAVVIGMCNCYVGLLIFGFIVMCFLSPCGYMFWLIVEISFSPGSTNLSPWSSIICQLCTCRTTHRKCEQVHSQRGSRAFCIPSR